MCKYKGLFAFLIAVALIASGIFFGRKVRAEVIIVEKPITPKFTEVR